MYDAVDVSAIPQGAEIVAGYVDGNWPTFSSLAAAFPNAQRVSITVTGASGARVADLEPPNFGGGTMQEIAAAGAQWAKAELAAGRRPCLYYSKANAGIVGSALTAAGVAPADVDFWPADWTGQAHLVAGSVATQYASPSTGSGGNFDVSETDGTWPAVAPPPPQPVPEPTTEDDMDQKMKVYDSEGGRHVFIYEETPTLVVHHWWQALAGPYNWNYEKLSLPA